MPVFEIAEFTEARLATVTTRIEKHGDEDKPAVSLGLELTVANTMLDVIDPTIRQQIYKAVEGQDQLPGIEVSTPVLRSNSFDRHTLIQKYDGWTLHVDDGIDDTAPMTFGSCKVDKMSVEAKQGGRDEGRGGRRRSADDALRSDEMGREVRRVPANWKHPTDGHYPDGSVRYVPLFDGKDYAHRVSDWDADAAKWARGEFPDYASEEHKRLPYEDWGGPRPDIADYMPQWTEEEATHLMMYEDTNEGTPISPAFATPEELARWLTDNEASSFGAMTADYEHWLRVARGGWAPGLIITDGVMESGVQAADIK